MTRHLAPLERLHVAITVPVAVGAGVGFPLLGMTDPSRERAQTLVASGAALTALTWWIASAGLSWFRRHRDSPEPIGLVRGRTLALLTGVALGTFAGVYHEPEPFGRHLGAFCVDLGLLPLALFACMPRLPVWRPFVDVLLLMLGTEIGAQLTLSYSKWGHLRWWDDISGMNLAYFEGATAVAVVWFLVSYRVRRRVVVRPEGDVPAPRKPA